jgi:hypothetical protein
MWFLKRIAARAGGSPTQSSTLDGVPFARRRFLALAGALVFGAATELAMPRAAQAYVEFPCHNVRACDCCNMTGGAAGNCTSCDSQGFTNRTAGTCSDGPQQWLSNSCWRGCGGDDRVYFCCDFSKPGANYSCTCRCRVPNSSCSNPGQYF